MPPITDPTKLAELVDLNQASLDAYAAVQTRAAERNEAIGRRDSLREQLAAHNRAEPAAAPNTADELSAALASDPNAAASSDWSDKLIEGEAAASAARATWQGRRTVFVQAIVRVDGEVAELEAIWVKAELASEEVAQAFYHAARSALVREMELRFDDFYQAVLGPLDGLNSAIGGRAAGISPDSVLAIGYGHAGSIFHTRKLFPAADRAIARQALANFRLRLNEPLPAKARTRG